MSRVIDPRHVAGSLKSIEHRAADDFLARDAFKFAEGGERLLESGVGSKGECHPIMTPLWYQSLALGYW